MTLRAPVSGRQNRREKSPPAPFAQVYERPGINGIGIEGAALLIERRRREMARGNPGVERALH